MVKLRITSLRVAPIAWQVDTCASAASGTATPTRRRAAQDGPDRVDGHRTIAFVIGPCTQTGKVDSTR